MRKEYISFYKISSTQLKKTLIISSILLFLISCGNNTSVSEIEKYINEVNNNNHLTESITEYNTENLDSEIIAALSTYLLKDKNGEVYRITVEIVPVDEPPANYEFYFNNDKLTYSHIIQYNDSGEDTIMNSKYYFKDTQLLKQIDKLENKMDAEVVKQMSAFHLVYAKEQDE